MCRLRFISPLSVLLLLALAGQTASAPRARPVIFVVDASGSMTLPFNGISRMAAARRMLRQHLGKVSPSVPVGLVAYGNGIMGCRSARIYARVRPQRTKKVLRIVDHMIPAGNTPLANTLRLVRLHVLPQHPGARIILLTDGAESCGGNPLREAARLRTMGASLHVIGIAVDPRLALRFKAMASIGGGRFYRAANDRDLGRALTGSLAQRRMRNRVLARRWGLNSRTRRTYDTGVRPLTPGTRAKGSAALRSTKPRETFVITRVEKSFNRPGKVDVEVSFRFERTRKTDYHISIHALPRMQTPGLRKMLTAGPKTHGVSGSTFYAVRKGAGRVKFELPRRLLNEQVVFQGELWETGTMPAAMQRSNSLPLQ